MPCSSTSGSLCRGSGPDLPPTGAGHTASPHATPASDWLGPDSGSHIRYSASSATNRRPSSLPSGAAPAAKASAAELVPPPLQDVVFKRPAAASSLPKRASKKRVDKDAVAPKHPSEEAEDETPATEGAAAALESEIKEEDNQAALGFQSLELGEQN